MNTSFLNKWHTAIRGCRHSVFVYAYTNLNVGDDLFLHRLISSYPHIRFVMLVRKPYRQMFSGYPNVTVYEAEGALLRVGRRLRIEERIRWRIAHECDYAVLIGGSVFKEDSKWKNQHLWYRDLFDHDRLFFTGCSWGPSETKRFEENMREILSDMKDVCFRDRSSCDTFSALPNVRYAPDILFGLDWSPYAHIREEKQVMISVIDCRSESAGLAEYAARYNAFIAGLAQRFAELGYRTVLCSFCEGQGDLAAAEEIRSGLPAGTREKVAIAGYRGTNLEQILQLIAASEYVVATRFHAMILGLLARKKVLPLIYHPKLRNVLTDLCFRDVYFDVRQLPEETDGLIPRIGRGITDEERESLIRLAAGHFEALDRILK